MDKKFNHSTPVVLKWLEINYEEAEGVCIPRSFLYSNYTQYCQEANIHAVNAANFGKILRQEFPKVLTRRLGHRGRSKYHYYGICIKETSEFYKEIYGRKMLIREELSRKSEKRFEGEHGISQVQNALDLPNIDDCCIPSDLPQDKIITFTLMYSTHCQRILSTSSTHNFTETCDFLIHFWQMLPPHLYDILNTDIVVKIVVVYDLLVYKALCQFLKPNPQELLPAKLSAGARTFGKNLLCKIKEALSDSMQQLRSAKLRVAEYFCLMLMRLTTINHIFQESQLILGSGLYMEKMLRDWQNIDVKEICNQSLQLINITPMKHRILAKKINKSCKEFEKLLENKGNRATIMKWLHVIVDRFILKKKMKRYNRLQRCKQLMMIWNYFTSKVIRELTLHGADSFGHFHLINMLCSEYLMYLLEEIRNDERLKLNLNMLRKEPIKDIRLMIELFKSNPRIKNSSLNSTKISMDQSKQQILEDQPTFDIFADPTVDTISPDRNTMRKSVDCLYYETSTIESLNDSEDFDWSEDCSIFEYDIDLLQNDLYQQDQQLIYGNGNGTSQNINLFHPNQYAYGINDGQINTPNPYIEI
ncbi:Transcription factor RFX4 [Trichoplax sp. H2]|nr:Transcription factor RFX4 [Trichoplax sp. H2]|eukprot:RDD38181.1 Transcription factor RFX4 [Trichoplax sp. H2]